MKMSSVLDWQTPDIWVAEALRDPIALLSDHAYLERKACSNALELLNRWPEVESPGDWPAVLSSIARDEARHLEQVLRQLKRCGGTLQRLHKSRYASDLRGLVRMGHAKRELMDRLLVSALIEARSCERFELLGHLCPDVQLSSFYRSLAASESGHYAIFLELGHRVLPQEAADRWLEMRHAEAKIARTQPEGPTLHSGLKKRTRAGSRTAGLKGMLHDPQH